MNYADEIRHLITVGARGIWTTSAEEDRIISLLSEVDFDRPIYRWSSSSGLRDSADQTLVPPASKLLGAAQVLKVQKEPLLILFLDSHIELAKEALRAFKELVLYSPHVSIVITPQHDIPAELQHHVIKLPFQLPTQEDIVSSLPNIPAAYREEVSASALGLTLREARFAVDNFLYQDIPVGETLIKKVWDYKVTQISDNGIISIEKPTESWADVAGLYKFKEWIEQRLPIFSPEARKRGKPVPRGVLFVGPFGTGKSLVSRVIAAKLGWHYVEWRLDKLMDKWVGSTEANTRHLIELTELHAPCVVRIDEITNQVSGFQSSGYTDSGVVSRMIGSILTWMEERDKDIFFAASTNEPWSLPGHMTRAGRFDAVFYVGLPKADAMEEVLQLKLKKYASNVLLKKIELSDLARELSEHKFSAAEAEQVVIEAVQVAYPKDPTIKHLRSAFYEIIPSAVTMAEQTQRIEEWAKTRARSAN